MMATLRSSKEYSTTSGFSGCNLALWSEWARMVCKLMEIVGVHKGSSTISLGEVQQHQALFFLLLLAPPIIQTFNWESVFYLFGLLGIGWFIGFQFLGEERGDETTTSHKPENTTREELGNSLKEIPWKSFFKSSAVWAMIYTHFCGSWGHYTCLSWLPTYFSEALSLNLRDAAWVSILPPLASIFVTSLASQFADHLISNGVETTTVRKICQTIAFLAPAICMTLSSVDIGLPPWEIAGILTAGLALSSFALSGLYCTHQDISPEYASILLASPAVARKNPSHASEPIPVDSFGRLDAAATKGFIK
ncbi:hypothetical protein F2Q68_00007587 [Brassica cretica]|uniref:Major facilitator superfamily (MFS) profile domain-containing protein n=1 Tax=Brassica cretica TaxID=69181 RepID=A0A8S9L6N6_BRACR|nr:hypothetical protein F2Q68_00007587 [Brassica cretica]